MEKRQLKAIWSIVLCDPSKWLAEYAITQVEHLEITHYPAVQLLWLAEWRIL